MLRFAPYTETESVPNVVVDGRGNAGTVLTLSHWPHAPCPPDLRRDLSAQSALDYLGHAPLHDAAEVVTNNHFDQDGLMSAFALVEPEAARARSDLVIEVARAGDFALTEDDDAARISMALAAYADSSRSPLDPAVFDGPYDETCAALYAELLPRVVELLDDPGSVRELWEAEDDQRHADAALLASGRAMIDEVPELDLTVVELPADLDSAGGHRFGGGWADRIHPMALHGAIQGFAVLLVQGPQVELRYRYESWVQYQSRPVRPRVDLAPLAEELTALEPAGVTWRFDGASALTPTLATAGGAPTELDPIDVRQRVEATLRAAPPAFDPYALRSPAPS